MAFKAFKKIHFKDFDLTNFQNNVFDKFRELSKVEDIREDERETNSVFYGPEVFTRQFKIDSSNASTFNIKTIQKNLRIVSIEESYYNGTSYKGANSSHYFEYIPTTGLCRVVVSSGTVEKASIKIRYTKK